MGGSVDHGLKILNLCRENNINLYVNYVRRSLPAAKEIKNRILSDTIKAPVKSVIWYSKGINHNGSHFINLMEFWFGKCIDIKLINKGREFEDFGFEPQVYMKFENAESTLIPAWEEFYSHYTIEIISASGRLYWNQKTLRWKGLDSSNSVDDHVFLSEISEDIFTGSNKYQKYVADELYSAMMGSPNSISSGEEALETLETLDRILSLK
jgi:predicted dehydrogenase